MSYTNMPCGNKMSSFRTGLALFINGIYKLPYLSSATCQFVTVKQLSQFYSG